MPGNVAMMRAVAASRPDLPQIACFDTAFHHTLQRIGTQIALPQALTAAGVPCISHADSAVEVRIIAADEEAVIARHTQSVIDVGKVLN